jgi:hypothetical protein
MIRGHAMPAAQSSLLKCRIFCTQKVKPNLTMKRQAAPNHKKRKGKKVESNINLETHKSNLQTTKTTK